MQKQGNVNVKVGKIYAVIFQTFIHGVYFYCVLDHQSCLSRDEKRNYVVVNSWYL